jgi:mono/diheme cytochrome c family protein
MDTTMLAKFGLLFLVLGFSATFLMYHLWGYPFDKETRTSEAPRWAMYTHRGIGYLYVVVYVLLMWHMLPRLWHYQVEFPARTVAHIILGFTIGFLLIIKISIMRFFRHFEEWMPYLGTAIMLCTVVLLGLSLPLAFQERALAAKAEVFSERSKHRMRELLPQAGLPKQANIEKLISNKGLRRGRQVLLRHCVRCHDLKTILSKPRSPRSWWRTVERMGEKPALFDPIESEDQWYVTAYLVGITPPLQRAQKRLRAEEEQRQKALQAAKLEPQTPPPPTDGDAGVPPAPTKPALPPVDPAKAKATFERVCSGCHDASDVDDDPPRTMAAVSKLVQRMIEENEMEATKDEIRLIEAYLNAQYVQTKKPKK